MSKRLIESAITTLDTEQQTPPLVDLATTGWKKLTTTTWLQDTIQKSHTLADQENDDGDDLHHEVIIEEADLLYVCT